MKPCIRCKTMGTKEGVCLQSTPHGSICGKCINVIVADWVKRKDVGLWV
jgi:hypothetical protein